MPDIVVVEDDELVRGGLCDWLATVDDLKVVGEASSAEECLRLVDTKKPHIALVDIILPGISGLELISKIRQKDPSVKCLILSGTIVPERVLDAFAAGAVGFLPKLTSPDEVRCALDYALKGKWYISPLVTEDVLKKILQLRNSMPTPSDGVGEVSLSDKERELLKLIAEGYNFTEIANHLAVSFRSVERMKHKLEEKLNAHRLVDLIRTAIRMGLINL